MSVTLVTGATGLVGGNIARALLKAGRTVRVLRRRSSSLRNIRNLSIETAIGDIRDLGSLEAAMKGVEIVHHSAAIYALGRGRPMFRPGQYTHHDPTVYENEGDRARDIITTAVQGTLNVIDAAARAGTVRRIVYTSSTAAVGASPSKDAICDENWEWNLEGLNTYVSAKREAEVRGLAHARERGLEFVAINPSGVIGPWDQKPTPTGALILAYLRYGFPFYLPGGLNLVDARDVAQAHLLAETKGRPGERYLACGDNTTIQELLQVLHDLTGFGKRTVPIPVAPLKLGLQAAERMVERFNFDVPLPHGAAERIGLYYWYSHNKASRELGFAPRNLRDTLTGAVTWFAEAGFLTETRMAKLYRKFTPEPLEEPYA